MSKKSLARLRQDGVEKVWEKYERDAIYIAKIYGVHYTSVYNCLRSYCIENGKNYQRFLRQPHKPHVVKHKVHKVDSDIDFIFGILSSSTPGDVQDIKECAHMLSIIKEKIKEAI